MGTKTTGDTAPYLLARRYIWGEALASHAGAAVHRGLDPVLERSVVVYLFTPQALARMGGKEQFLREAARVELLDHSAVRELLDFGTHDGSPFFVFAETGGETLAERLEHGPLPADEARQLLRRAGKALRKAHAGGIAHGSIDPGHIYLDPRHGPQIFGFGWPRDGAPTRGFDLAALEALRARLLPSASDGPAEEVRPAPAPAKATSRPSFELSPAVQRWLPVAAVSGVIAGIGVAVLLAAAWFGGSSPATDTTGAGVPNGQGNLTQAVAGERLTEESAAACGAGRWRNVTAGEAAIPLFRDEQSCLFYFSRGACPAPAILLEPAPTAGLTAPVTVRWSPGCDVDRYELLVDGHPAGGPFAAGVTSTQLATVPTTGAPVLITLVSHTPQGPYRHDVTYETSPR